MSVADLRPPISPPEYREADVDGGLVMNIAAVVQMARDGDTPECRFLSRRYAAEYRALEGEGLPHKERELRAFRSAWDRMHQKFGVPQIIWPA